MPSFVTEFFDVMLDTEEFFRKIKGWGTGRALSYFAFISLLSLFISWLLLLYGVAPAGLIPFEKILEGAEYLTFYIPLVYFASGFFFVAFYSLLVSGLLGRMGARTGKRQVFKTTAYGFTPSLITLWIPVLGVLLVAWSLYLVAMGLGVYNAAPLNKNVKACIAGAAMTGGVMLLFLVGMGISLISFLGLQSGLLWSVLLPF